MTFVPSIALTMIFGQLSLQEYVWTTFNRLSRSPGPYVTFFPPSFLQPDKTSHFGLGPRHGGCRIYDDMDIHCQRLG